MKKIINFALVAFAAAAVFAACTKPAANTDEQKQEEQQQEEQQQEEQPDVKTADFFVVNTPAWEAPVMWAWGNDAIKMPGDWPNGIEPEAAKVTEGGKEYVHFVLGEAFIADGIGLLIVDKTTSVQTVDVAGLSIKAGDKLYYEIGAEAGEGGKYALTKVE